MPFDVEGARKAGYSEAEIADHLAQQSRFDAPGARKAGYTDAELINHLRPTVSSFTAKPTERQELLTSAPMRVAKGGMDAVTGAAQMIQHSLPQALSDRVNAGADEAGDWLNRNVFNRIGLPGNFAGEVLGIRGMNTDQMREDIKGSEAQYQEARRAVAPANDVTGEREPGLDAMRLAGNVVNPVSLTVGKFLPGLRAGAPLTTLAKTGAVGGAVGAATQPVESENFASQKAGQVALGAAAGAVLGPVAARLGESAARVVERWANNRGVVTVTPERLQQLISKQLADDGIDVKTIPQQVFQTLADDVRAALGKGKNLDAAAALRAKDFEALGLPFTRGQVGRNPSQWQREFNLMGVEGVGEPLQELAQRQSQGVARHLARAADGAGEVFDDGGRLMAMAQAAQQVRDGNVRAAYDAFRQATGRELNVPLQGLAQDYARTLETFGDGIPAAVRRQFEGLGLMSGSQRRGLSIEQAEGLIKTINANTDPANRVGTRALGDLRSAVQRAITDVAGGDAEGAMAAQLAQEARGFAAANFRNQAATPGLRAAIEGMEPDQFVQRFVIGGKVNEIERLGEAVGPEGQKIMRAQMSNYLQQKVFGANAAGDGKAAQDAFNRELMRIGKPKLVALLGEDGADEMLRIGRVLAYIKQPPEGAIPNASGSGQMLASVMGRMRGLTGLPYVNDFLVKPVGRFADRQVVKSAMSGVPVQPTQLDPKTVDALASLFATVPLAGGVAAGKATR